jgi:hypothetical protein
VNTLTLPADYRLDAAGTVHVCAWCFPMQADFIRKYPELDGKPMTHGICPKHRREVLQGALLANGRN